MGYGILDLEDVCKILVKPFGPQCMSAPHVDQPNGHPNPFVNSLNTSVQNGLCLKAFRRFYRISIRTSRLIHPTFLPDDHVSKAAEPRDKRFGYSELK